MFKHFHDLEFFLSKHHLSGEDRNLILSLIFYKILVNDGRIPALAKYNPVLLIEHVMQKERPELKWFYDLVTGSSDYAAKHGGKDLARQTLFILYRILYPEPKARMKIGGFVYGWPQNVAQFQLPNTRFPELGREGFLPAPREFAQGALVKEWIAKEPSVEAPVKKDIPKLKSPSAKGKTKKSKKVEEQATENKQKEDPLMAAFSKQLQDGQTLFFQASQRLVPFEALLMAQYILWHHALLKNIMSFEDYQLALQTTAQTYAHALPLTVLSSKINAITHYYSQHAAGLGAQGRTKLLEWLSTMYRTLFVTFYEAWQKNNWAFTWFSNGQRAIMPIPGSEQVNAEEIAQDDRAAALEIKKLLATPEKIMEKYLGAKEARATVAEDTAEIAAQDVAKQLKLLTDTEILFADMELVPETFDRDAYRKALRALSLKWHPDKVESPAEKKIANAVFDQIQRASNNIKKQFGF